MSQRDVLQVHLFGGFTLTYDGDQVPPLASRHARLLFAWLVLQGGRPQPRALLCDRFWPDLPESRARRRLSHALWQVQDAFGETGPDRPYLLTPGDQVQFDAAAPYWLDVEEFEQRLDEVDRAGGVDGPTLRHLERCVELYQGDLLAGSYEDWVVREQERLRQRHVTALSRLVEAAKQRGNFDQALTVARRLTHQAPLREEAHREVMRLSVLLGQPSLALEQFERCRSVLDEELGASPSAATVDLYDRIVATRAADTPTRGPERELVTDRLVARDAERGTLVDQLERTLAGVPGTVFVEGEPGVGKTQLLAQAAEDARWRGFTVLWGSCSGPEVPYAALRHALLPELDPVRVAQLRALVAPVWLDEAARLLPPLARRRGPAASLPGGDAATRMRQALSEVLVGLASIDPVVLVLEDLHRADRETLAVLGTIARQQDPGRLLVLLSYRDVASRHDERVWSALRELDRDARPVRLHLEPLTPFETGALLREVLGTAHLSGAFVERLHRECGGNPLYLLELLRAWRDAGALPEGVDHIDQLEVPVTSGLRSLIGERLERLGWEAATVAEFAAVLQEDLDLELLQAGVGLGPRQLSTALGDLARRHLLQTDGETWSFAHAATRTVLLETLDDANRTRLHLAVADALEAARPDTVEAIAHHLRQAGEAARALPYLRRAAVRALDLHAYETAAAHLDHALDVADHQPIGADELVELLLEAEAVHDVLGHRDRQADLLDRLDGLVVDDAARRELAIRRAQHLALVDRGDDALAIAEEAAAGAPRPVRARALTVVGETRHWQGHHDGAITALREAVGLADGGDGARARAALAAALRAQQQYDDARAILDETLALARTEDDEPLLVRALGGLADLDAETGHHDAAVSGYERAIGLARTIGYRHREGVGLVNLGTVRLIRGEVAAALRAFDEAEAVFAGLGNPRGTAFVRLNRAWLLHRWLGLDDRAAQDALAALQWAEDANADGLVPAARETLAGVARRAGRSDEAHGHLDAGLAVARAVGDVRAALQLERGRAELAWSLGDGASTRRIATAAVATAKEHDQTEYVADLAALAAVAAVAADDEAARGSWVAEATAHLPTSGAPHRVHHHLALTAASVEDAAHHHRTSLELLETALAGLDAAMRTSALATPTHAAIIEAGALHSPQSFDLRLARRDAPRGRPLTKDETIIVDLVLAPPASTPTERRQHLLTVLQQVEDQHAIATVEDLSTVFDVSPSTIRRDLRALRGQGHDVATRGSDTG